MITGEADAACHVCVCAQVGHRIQHLEVSRGFNTWSEHAAQLAHEGNLLGRAMQIIKSPLLMKGLVTWKGHVEEHKRAIGIVRRAMLQYKMVGACLPSVARDRVVLGYLPVACSSLFALYHLCTSQSPLRPQHCEMAAIAEWKAETAELRRAKSLMLRARAAHVKSMLRCWRVQYGHPDVKGGPCAALLQCLRGGSK